ncbi:MAG: class I SAM-dependent methyltransferase [Bacillota bacterium]|nr:class I SAM-dependent methyltransferase [Bacillota bacterium]
MSGDNVEKQYDSMSFFYDVLYSGVDKRAWEEAFIDEFRDLLSSLPANAKVLDSSCGNGIQAAALKRNGIDVTATDISEEMINLTEKYAQSNNLSFPTKRLSWEQLPDNFDDEFDVVFCYGNSISHSINKEDMFKNIRSLYKVAKNGGKLVIDTRNWDKVINDNVRFVTSDVKEYLDKKYIFTYIWNLNGFDVPSSVEILFVEILNGKETKCIPSRLDFTPFKHDEFVNRLKACGLKILSDNYQPDNDYYSIIFEK